MPSSSGSPVRDNNCKPGIGGIPQNVASPCAIDWKKTIGWNPGFRQNENHYLQTMAISPTRVGDTRAASSIGPADLMKWPFRAMKTC